MGERFEQEESGLLIGNPDADFVLEADATLPQMLLQVAEYMCTKSKMNEQTYIELCKFAKSLNDVRDTALATAMLAMARLEEKVHTMERERLELLKSVREKNEKIKELYEDLEKTYAASIHELKRLRTLVHRVVPNKAPKTRKAISKRPVHGYTLRSRVNV